MSSGTDSGRARVALIITGVSAALIALGWSVSAVPRGLFWDDVNVFEGMADVRGAPFDPGEWGELLTHHPPTAYAGHLALFEVFPGSFAVVAHVVQLLVLVALLALLAVSARREMGTAGAAAAVGVCASWPIVASAGQTITLDLATGLLGFGALAAVARRRDVLALVLLIAAGLAQFTAIGLLGGILPVLWRRGHERNRAWLAAFSVAGLIPLLWIGWQRLRGAPSRNFALIETDGYFAIVKLWVTHGLRHALEVAVFDGRWLLTGTAIVLLVSGRAVLARVVQDPIDVAMAGAAAGVLVVATVLGGTDSLQRYLLPAAAPLAWVTVRLIRPHAGPARAMAVAGGIALGVLTGLAPEPSTVVDRALGERWAGLARSIDANPSWLRAFVSDRETLAGRVPRQGVTGAPWPASVYLAEPAAGFVREPRQVREWYPGDPTCGLDRVWVDRSRTTAAVFEKERRDRGAQAASIGGHTPAFVAPISAGQDTSCS